MLGGDWYSGTVYVWDFQTGDAELTIRTEPYGLNDVAYSPSGEFIALVNNNRMQVWNVQSGEKILSVVNLSSSFFTSVSFSPDGQFILTADDGGQAQLWDIAIGGQIKSYIGPLSLNDAKFSPDGSLIVTVDDKKAHLWDINTATEIRQFIGHTASIWSVSFSPDGGLIATASADGTSRLWNVQTGQEIRRLAGHESGVENLVFSSDGNFLATIGDDGTARLWDVDYHTTIKFLCSVLQRDFTDAERLEYNITDPSPTCSQP